MKSDSNLCPECGAGAPIKSRLCASCATPVVRGAKGSIEFWRLGDVRPAILNGMVRVVSQSLGLPVVLQPSFLDPRPSRRTGWNGVSATAFLNQIDRRSRRGTTFSVGITEENIVPGASWNYLFGYAYLGMPSCVVSLHELSSDDPSTALLLKRAAAIAIHEIGHNCGLDHHDYDEGVACVMTADTDLDCLDRLDEGTHRFCRACSKVVERKLRH